MEFKVRDGARIYYETYGDNKNMTLIFLHGNMEDSSFFKKQVEYFVASYHIVVLDTRGHGKSDWGYKYNLRLLSEDLKEVVVGLNLKKYILVGFSDGANIAMEFASSRFEGLLRLVLVGGNLRPWGMKIGALLEIIKDYMLSYRKRDGVEKRKMLGLMLFEPRISRKDLASIKVPTLVLAGENDLIKRRETLRIGQSINGSKIIFINDADHFFIYNNWDIFNKMLEQWINSV